MFKNFKIWYISIFKNSENQILNNCYTEEKGGISLVKHPVYTPSNLVQTPNKKQINCVKMVSLLVVDIIVTYSM